MDQHDALLSALRNALPAEALSLDLTALEEQALDALGARRGFDEDAAPAVPPLALVFPASTQQVSDVVRVAVEHRVPVVPYGGGSGLMGGARTVRPGLVIDLKRMSRMRELDAASGWAWIEAGAVLGDVNRELAPHGLLLGHDPWTVDIATVGGTISTNGLGFLGGKYGSMGQQVLALEVVLADGRVLRTRPAQPHSTGIDLTRLFVGAEGTMGIITAAAVRVFPLPESSVRFGYRFDTFDAGFAAILQMRRVGLAPAMLDYGERTPPMSGGDWKPEPPTLYVGFEGLREEVEGQVRRAAAICDGAAPIDAADVEQFWSERHVPAERFAQRRRRAWPPLGQNFDYVHVSLPMPSVLEYRERAISLAKAEAVDVVETGLWVHPGLFSMVLVSSGDDATARMSRAVDACLRLANEAGGSVEYCHGVGVRLAHLMREEHAIGLDVMRAVKRALDPHDILNPGKLALDG